MTPIDSAPSSSHSSPTVGSPARSLSPTLTRPAGARRDGPLAAGDPWPARSLEKLLGGVAPTGVRHEIITGILPPLTMAGVRIVSVLNNEPSVADAPLLVGINAGSLLYSVLEQYRAEKHLRNALMDIFIAAGVERTALPTDTEEQRLEAKDQICNVVAAMHLYLQGASLVRLGLAAGLAASLSAAIATQSPIALGANIGRATIAALLACAIFSPEDSRARQTLRALTGTLDIRQLETIARRARLEEQRVALHLPSRTEQERAAAGVELRRALAELPQRAQGPKNVTILPMFAALSFLDFGLGRIASAFGFEDNASNGYAAYYGGIVGMYALTQAVSGFWMMQVAAGLYEPDYIEPVEPAEHNEQPAA